MAQSDHPKLVISVRLHICMSSSAFQILFLNMLVLSRITQIYRRKHLYERLRPNNKIITKITNKIKTITWIKEVFSGKRKN